MPYLTNSQPVERKEYVQIQQLSLPIGSPAATTNVVDPGPSDESYPAPSDGFQLHAPKSRGIPSLHGRF